MYYLICTIFGHWPTHYALFGGAPDGAKIIQNLLQNPFVFIIVDFCSKELQFFNS